MLRRLALVLLVTTTLHAGQLVENVATRKDGTQTYTLYLPGGYDAKKPAPLLFVFDPRGRGTLAAQLFREAAEEYGWIVISSNNTHSLAVVDPNERAVHALLPEIDRYAVDHRRIYAAGFSGMALLSWSVGIKSGLLAGVIASGGRLVDEVAPRKFSFAHYGFSGVRDYNNRDMRAIDALLEDAHKTHRFAEFEGEHDWMPPALARDAIAWMEIVAMKEQRRTRDDALVARIFDEDVAAAAKLEGRSALRRYREIARTYDGLRPLDDVRAAIVRLETDPAVKREIADETKWDAFEQGYVADVFERMGVAYAAAKDVPRPNLARHFRVAELQKRAQRAGAEGVAARRVLESVYAQTTYFLPRLLFARGEYRLVAATVEVALLIHPDAWPPWYNLGAARARMNDRARALDALGKAVAHGFHDAAHLASDDDYASLREDARFKELLAGLAPRSQ